jgi:hypothetical protein
MPNALQTAGSAGRKQTAAAPIFVNEMFTGLWTQGNPLRDRAVGQLIQKFYQGTRNDGLLDGRNVEISNRLTLVRRCGASVYNSQTFPPIQRFYEFRRAIGQPAAESIILVADSASYIYNATGPSTQTTIFTKSAGAQQTSFQSVGNALYFGDGVDQKKWLQPGPWAAQTALATTSYAIGTTIIDPNGKLEYLNAFQVGTITNVALSANIATITFSGTNFTLQTGMSFTILGLTGASFLNGSKLIALTVLPSGSNFVVTAFFQYSTYASTADSGTATTTDVGTPVTTGASIPTFSGSVGGTTADGLSTWTNFGNPIYNWGAPHAPVQAPSIGLPPPFGLFCIWQPSTATNTSYQLLLDTNGGIQQLITSGTTGPRYPTFTESFSSTLTADGTAAWNYLGNIANASWRPNWNPESPMVTNVIIDSNGNVQINITGSATTGSTQPTWNTTLYGHTTDGGITWANYGPFVGLAYKGWQYGYCYHCVDGSLSSMSAATPSTYGVGDGTKVQVVGSADPQVDSIWLFRTTDGGGSNQMFFRTSLPNPGAIAYIINDSNPDLNLNVFIQAPQASSANPPPIGTTALTYHLGKIFYAVGNMMGWSAGAESAFNGNTAFPPLNNFILPSLIERFVPLTIGLLIFTTSGVYFSGIGGANSDQPLAPAPWMAGKVGGLMSYNALDVVGSTIYIVNSKKMCKAVEISAGESEVGFPVGDVLAGKSAVPVLAGVSSTGLNPATVYVSYHEQDSTDTGLYLATPGNAGSAWWMRMNATPAPETGLVWSPPAVSAQGYSAVQSVETSPGIHQLLMGPPAAGGPILFRDPTTNADNGTSFTAYADIGALVLAFGGQAALLYFITTDCIAIGSRPTVSVLLQNLGGHANMGTYGAVLPLYTADPPQLGPAESATVYNDRWWLSGTQQPAYCRYMTLEIAWPAENYPNELLSYTLFGEHYQEI